MATAAHDVFTEHLGVISALRDNYARQEDASAVAGLVRAQQEAAAASTQREDQAKSAIKELTKRVQKAEREATYPADEAAHAAAVAELAGASAAAQENVDGLNVQLRELAAQREDVKAKVAALQRKAEHIEEIVTEAEPRTRHQLSLYAHVSTITWQFERHPQRVAGTVSDPLRAFDFDPLTTSSFDIANALWDLMRDDDDEGGDAAAGSTAAGNN